MFKESCQPEDVAYREWALLGLRDILGFRLKTPKQASK